MIICHRGLSAQELDLYDYRYYRLFEDASQISELDIKESAAQPTTIPTSDFSTYKLDYNLSFVRSTRRGIASYERTTTLNGVEIPYLGRGSARRLRLGLNQTYGCSTSGLGGELQLRIDSVADSRTNVGVRFLSRNMPYSISASTSHKFGKGWSLATDMVARTGRDIYVEGVFGSSLAIDLVAIKEFNARNRVAAALFVEPSMRSSRLSSTEEAFRLTGNKLYNPAWGFQDGKVRNSRIRRSILPTLFLAYEGEIFENIRLDIGLSLTSGIERYSALEWFDAQTPTPDNYRYMPSYFSDEEDIFTTVESAWLLSNPRYTQIDFDRLIATNRLSGGQAVYAIADRVARTLRTSARAAITTKLRRGEISCGIDIKVDNTRNYKEMRDLLGAEYIADVDYFLIDDDTYGNSLQNNLDNPDRVVKEGGRYGYDYALRRNDISGIVSYKYSDKRLHLDLSARVGYTDISRNGFYRKELFADNSLGRSRKIHLPQYQLRGYAEYRLGTNHLFAATIAAEVKGCDTEAYFLQTQYNNRAVDNAKSRQGYGADLRYIYKRANFTLSTTLFATATIADRRVEHIYDDLSGEYADVVISAIDMARYGLEVEGEYRFADHFRASLALCAARYQYIDNASVTTYSDKSNIILAKRSTSHIRNLSLGNAPQLTAVASLSYYNRGWWVALDANYAALRYVEPSIVMRTERVLSMATSPEQRNSMKEQERLRDAFTLDISLSKSIYLAKAGKRIYHKRTSSQFFAKHPFARIILRVGIRNILGSSNMVYSARESSRLQRYKIADEYIYSRQATRYSHSYPRIYEASASFRF